jgi:hypothetical protein
MNEYEIFVKVWLINLPYIDVVGLVVAFTICLLLHKAPQHLLQDVAQNWLTKVR